MSNIILQYLQWHFVDQPRAILRAWKNFLLFNLNYWSVPSLLKTFFSYWRKYRYSYGRGFDIKGYLETFSFNAISRVMGAIMRSILIFFGIISEIFIFFAGIIVFAGWLALPILILTGLWLGFTNIF